MFSIRRRWPVLTAVGAALLYGVNNYQIAGLEHLHLQPLNHPNSAASSHFSHPSDGASQSPLGFDLTQFGIQTSPSLERKSGIDFSIDPYSAASQSGPPAWNDLLSLGEKLALWQDRLSSDQSSPSSVDPPTKPTFPTSSPIPLPRGLTAPNFGLPTVGGSALQTSTTTNPTDYSTPREAFPTGMMTSLFVPPATTNIGSAPMRDAQQTVRIASFHLPGLGTAQLNKPQSVQVLVSILRQYDVVALQGIRTNRDDVLPLIVDKLNQSGRKYDYLIGPRVGRTAPHQQFAYIFDTSRLETDRYQLYSVDDPEDLMNYEPLVAWFRCTGPSPSTAFTFSLINVAIDPDFGESERSLLPALTEAIARDGRHEDDWIMLGDFAGGNAQLSIFDGSGIRFAISDIPTDVAGTRMLDTLMFSARATTEFTGRAGAFDFLRKYNLSIEQALEVSQHMPVWAEFSSIEGAQPGHIAPVADRLQ